MSDSLASLAPSPVHTGRLRAFSPSWRVRSHKAHERLREVANAGNRSAAAGGAEEVPHGNAVAHHSVDYRVSVGLPSGKRYYVTLLVGPERRNRERLIREGQLSRARSATVFGFVAMAALGCLVFGAFCLLYLLKSLLGINLFGGQSPLHPLYSLLLRDA